MKLQKELRKLMADDHNIVSPDNLTIFHSPKDSNHFMRRLQQRAISWDMVKLAIAYGKFQYHSNAKTWTIFDHCLIYTRYAKFIDKLRGLRIIAMSSPCEHTLNLLTAYWAYDLRR